MMPSPFLRALAALVVMLTFAVNPASSPTQAQSNLPELIRQANAPNMSDTKFPRVLGVNNTAYITTGSGTTRDRRASLVTMTAPFQTSGFSGNVDLGDADGASDFSVTASAVAPDGTIYIAWMQSSSNNFKIRRKGPSDGDFGPERTIVAGGGFRVRPDIAVTSDGKVFAIWDEDSRYRFRVSTDGGNSWSGTQVVSEDTSAGRPMLARDNVGGIWIAYGTSGNRNAGLIKAAYWRNGIVLVSNLTPDRSGADYFADPGIAVGPDNIPYVAWRNVEKGIWYAQRDPNTGTWNRSRLVSNANSYGTVAISADRDGNLHMAWAGDQSGSFEVWFAYKPLGQNWQGPVRGSSDGNLDANFYVSTTVSDFSYGHIVGERFTSGGLVPRYSAVRGQASGCIGTLVLKDASTGSTTITNENPIPGTITPSNCTPIQMQVSLNSPVVANTAKQTYSASPSFAIPAGTDQCVQTAYAHLYKEANASFSSGLVFSQSIIYDAPGDVDALVETLNPNASLIPVYSPFTGDVGTAVGASGGDPAWTRDLQFLMRIQDNADCSGLASFLVNAAGQTAINKGTYTSVLAIPTTAPTLPGLKTFDVTIADTIGNLKNFPGAINYDPLSTALSGSPNEAGRPVVISGTLTNDNTSATARKSIFRTLSFSGVNVTDNLYRPNNVGSQFWGVWVANGPRNVANPDPSTLQWIPVRVSQPGAAFTVSWNLFNNGPGPRLDQDGNYVVFVRFLDGAGNPSTRTYSTTMTLDPGYSLPSIYMPTLAK
jgi:hypothetical protein